MDDDRSMRLRELALALGPIEFSARFPLGFLLRRPAVPNGTVDPFPEDETAQFGLDTKLVSRAVLEYDAWDEDLLDEGGLIIVEIVKRFPGRTAERIVVGRARNCDVVLPYPSVSKVHAEFVLAGALVSAIVDGKSSNGTMVNDRRLSSGEQCSLAIGARVGFGALTLELVSARRAYAELIAT